MIAPFVASTMLARGALGFVAAAPIVLVARRARSLSSSGAFAAVVVGAAAVSAGWGWGALLVLYFVVASGLSHFRRAERERLTGGVVAKGGARDAIQVVANGGIFAASAAMALLGPNRFGVTMSIAALGALAAASADTWATEVGTLFGGTPRSILSGRAVPIGTSGAVSVAGLIAMVIGAAVVALGAALLGLPNAPLIVTGAGISGAMVDSILGATIQERRWCPSCERASEQRLHECGSVTTLSGGREWMDNDLVNLLATFAGAAVAAVLTNL